MSDDHKEAIRTGREQNRIVDNYLAALAATKPKRGRKRTADSVNKQLEAVNEQLEIAEGANRLTLVQRRLDLEQELANMEQSVDISELEEEFVNVAAEYGERKGISYAAWREVGVEPAVLSRAGISRSTR